jgi:hypothetical protein
MPVKRNVDRSKNVRPFRRIEQDRYNNCCLIETARAIVAAAKERKANFTLVSYPNAEHGFNLAVPAYRTQDDADAWKRTLEALREYVRPMQ